MANPTSSPSSSLYNIGILPEVLKPVGEELLQETKKSATPGCEEYCIGYWLFMLSPKPTFFILISSLSAFLSSATAARAPAGQKMIFGAQTVVSNGTYLCLSGRSDLSVTVINCRTQLDYVAWAVTAGSAASTAPPLGTITHQYVPTANSPRNGTFCLAVNVTTSNIATVPDGTNVVLKPCVSTDVAQQWAIREGDGTIRLGNGNKCLHPVFRTVDYTVQVTTCAAARFIGNIDQKWTPVPKPPGRGIAGFEWTYDLAWRQTIVQTEHAERRDVVKSKQYDDVCLRPQAQTSIYSTQVQPDALVHVPPHKHSDALVAIQKQLMSPSKPKPPPPSSPAGRIQEKVPDRKDPCCLEPQAPNPGPRSTRPAATTAIVPRRAIRLTDDNSSWLPGGKSEGDNDVS
ncbi:hypothetical protein C8J57DRAFT_1478886 [Mycena rebaudengoi]|nr:hypothetical protein C8J57DRAFT_1478886 [Mycena rebaudengoi]